MSQYNRSIVLRVLLWPLLQIVISYYVNHTTPDTFSLSPTLTSPQILNSPSLDPHEYQVPPSLFQPSFRCFRLHAQYIAPATSMTPAIPSPKPRPRPSSLCDFSSERLSVGIELASIVGDEGAEGIGSRFESGESTGTSGLDCEALVKCVEDLLKDFDFFDHWTSGLIVVIISVVAFKVVNTRDTNSQHHLTYP